MSTVPHAAVDPGRRSDAPPALLELRGVGKHFAGADRPALDGADLTVHEGDFIAIVGPSGSGKSSLLAVAAGLIHLLGRRRKQPSALSP